MYEHYDILNCKITQFVREHIDEKIIPTKSTLQSVSFKIEKDVTEVEYNMLVLNSMLKNIDDVLTENEKTAINYAIECIKTLDDMGILKGEQEHD
jgi:hypothetical protein